MRILYIDSKFGSPRASSHARVYHFGQRLLERGHEVTIIGRDSGRMELEGQRRRGMVTRGRLDGLEIVLLKVPYAQSFSKRMRIVSYGGFTLGAGLLAATAGPADVVFASSSPLTIGISGVLASRLRRTPFVFELQDLWPAVPIGMGFLTGRTEIKAAEALERSLYRAARRVAELGLENMIVLPDIPRDEIPLLVGAADVTLTAFAPYPILQTNSPNKFFDSLAAGKPPIVNLDGWLHRLVEENRVGVYVPPGDGKALADALADLAGKPELVRELGRNARALAEREFARDLLADRLADVLEA